MSGSLTGNGEVTRLLKSVSRGSGEAFNELLPLVYDELRNLAHTNLWRRGEAHTLSTTDLIHETYLKMAGQKPVEWDDRSHFFAVASRAMRQILIDHARRNQAAKRVNKQNRITLKSSHYICEINMADLLTLDQALKELEKVSERLHKVVEYQFFGGLMQHEIADILSISTRTVERDWFKAKLFLHSVMYPEY